MIMKSKFNSPNPKALSSPQMSKHRLSLCKRLRLDGLEQIFMSSERYTAALTSAKSQPFLDQDFPPNVDSIVGFTGGDANFYENFVIWQRPTQFPGAGKKGPPVTFDQIRPEVIQQGSLGNCYLLAACASIAQRPARLERIFLSGPDFQPQGVYAVAMCLNGLWQEIIVDDWFPCRANSGYPIFTYSRDTSIWVLLIEKAWAKVHGSYLQIKCGNSREALHDLTGAPTESVFIKKGSEAEKGGELWEKIKEAFEKEFIMCASSRKKQVKEDELYLKERGLKPSHAYSVLDAFEVKVKGNIIWR